MENKDYSIKPAHYAFSCPVCGTNVKQGENCIDNDGVLTCVCVLPARKLVPVVRDIDRLIFKIAELEKALKHLRIANLKMRSDFEVLIDHPQGKAANKIIGKYKRLRTIRDEKYLSVQN